MKITSLVTGGAGFIGSHVVDYLIKMNQKVVVLDDLSGGFIENVNSKAIFIKGDICDSTLVNKVFSEYKFSYVYHLAAYAAEGLSHFIRNFNYQNNLIGSINLINASVNNNVKCFVFSSSIAVYGNNELPLNEKQHPFPEDPYGIAKYAVEMDLKNAKEMFGMDYIIFRPHNVYGSRQNIADKYRNVVGIFMNQVLNDEKLTIFGDGLQLRAFTHVNDVAPYIANCVNVESAYDNTFNIGSDKVINVKELAEIVLELMDSSESISYLDKRKEVVHAYSNHDKFNKVFNPKTNISLKKGLLEMLDWVVENGAKKSVEFNNIEILKNLPKSWQ